MVLNQLNATQGTLAQQLQVRVDVFTQFLSIKYILV